MMDATEERESYRIRREWAKTAAKHFRFRFPEFISPLYEGLGQFFIVVDTEAERFNEMLTEFEKNIRPMTCPVRLVRKIDGAAVLVEEDQPYSAELWLNGSPLTVSATNTLFHISEPNLPPGGIDFNHELDAWTFMSPKELSEDERTRVKASMQKLGLEGEVHFQQVELGKPPPLKINAGMSMKSDMLRSSTSLGKHSQSARDLIMRDEDLWRNFLAHRASGAPEPVPTRPTEFSCLFDMSDKSEVRLSELLTIYDRVDIIPDRQNPDWPSKHQLPVNDLMQLIAMGRCRVVLPYGAEHCRPDILDGVASIDAMPPVLSRELAARTFLRGQSKDPLLYGPFTAKERSTVLSAIRRLDSHAALQAISTSYGNLFANQHHAFMLNGAMASTHFGVGAHLGELFAQARGVDARIELGLAGAGVEWAMALGSTWMPRSFGEGYDETSNSHLVASFMSRTRGLPVDPVASRLHALTNGLLAVTDIPPLEVARNFNSATVARFRTLARRLMYQAPTQAEMADWVEQINQETRRFERRAERLTTWRIDALAASVAAKPIGDAIDATFGGGCASILTFWLLQVLQKRLPDEVTAPLAGVRNLMLGLALAPSADAVVVSRSRGELSRQRTN